MTADFKAFMAQRQAAARAFVTGDPEPVVSLSQASGQATFFDPGGGSTEGAAEVNRVNREGARAFGPAGTTHFDVRDSAASDELAYWVGFQLAEVELKSTGKKVPMRIRVTEIFRRSGSEWKLIHRHASMAKDVEHSPDARPAPRAQ